MKYSTTREHVRASMAASDRPFETFEDLAVYQAAREFRKARYGVTRRLPAFERFELASQVRRAAVSLTNNITEGHGRFRYLGQIKFLLQARGSLQELVEDLNVCDDEHDLPAEDVAKPKQHGWQVLRLVNGYLRRLRERRAGQSLALHEKAHPYGNRDDDLQAWLTALPL